MKLEKDKIYTFGHFFVVPTLARMSFLFEHEQGENGCLCRVYFTLQFSHCLYIIHLNFCVAKKTAKMQKKMQVMLDFLPFINF